MRAPEGRRFLAPRAGSQAGARYAFVVAGLAVVLTQLGDKETAIRRISQYVGDHPQHVTGFERADFWWWRPLKDDPRFQLTAEQLKAKGIEDFQLNYALETLRRTSPNAVARRN